MATKKTQLSKYLPWILIAGAGAAAYYYFRPQPTITDETMPPVAPTLPGTTPPTLPPTLPPTTTVIAKPLQIGKSAKVKASVPIANGYITKFKGSIFPSGGNKGGLGGLKTTPGIDVYAGTVQEIDGIQKSVRVLNYQYPMKDDAGNNVYSYWLNYNDIEGNY